MEFSVQDEEHRGPKAAAYIKSPHDGTWSELQITTAHLEVAWEKVDVPPLPSEEFWNLNGYTFSRTVLIQKDDSNAAFFQQMFEYAEQRRALREFDAMQQLRRLAYERAPLLSLYPERN